MNKTDKILTVGLSIIFIVFIGGLIWGISYENKETNRKMIECFEEVDDPKWCYENLK